MRSDLVTTYPSFRSVSRQIASGKRTSGESVDFRMANYTMLDEMSLADIERHWNSQVAGHPIVWAVVGDPDKIGMEDLAKFGPVTKLKPADVIK